MPNQFTSSTFRQTYKDDWRDSDNYYRILFNSARPLQARELTQMQTIGQNQVTKFAKSIYKDGSPVLAGGLTLQYRQYVKLQELTSTLAVGDIVTGSSSGVVGVIRHIEQRVDTDNPLTIYVQYTNNGTVTSGASSVTFTAGETITSGAKSATVQATNTIVNPAFGFGTFASINSSTYFLKGFFVQVNDQDITVSKYSDIPNTTLGFIMVEDIVTYEDDEALYDNQNDLPNYTAPGADRFRITATLATAGDADSADDFFPIEIIQKGRFIFDPTDPQYSIIGDVMAERTKEESGDYVVRGFTSHYEPGESDGVLDLFVDPGIAYVDGYRVQRLEQSILSVGKSRTTTTINNEQVSASFGNYVIVDGATMAGVPNISEFQEFNLMDDSGYGGSVIGTANVRSIVQDGSNYRLHLIDINMNTSQSFRSVKSLGTSVNKFANIVLDNNIAVLKDAANNNALFELPFERSKSLSDISMTVQRRFSATTDGTGAATITLTDATETFANTTSWIVASTTDGQIYSASITGAGTQSSTITVSDTSEPIEIIAYVGKSQPSIRSKTLVEDATTVGPLVESDGVTYLSLSNTDIYSLTSVKDASNKDITTQFRLDNGQRDNFYDYGKVILRSGYSTPSGNVTATYDYFSHGATGDFFASNSYIGQVTYDNIPSYRQRNGEVIELRNALDFRSVKNSSGTFGSGSIVFELPSNTDLITFDAVYYNKRADQLVLANDGTLIYEPGAASLDPKFTNQTTGTLLLKQYELNGWTDNEEDLSQNYIDNRRYTMRDIGKLERRINELEETTTLNLLELEANTLEVVDSNGINRFKTGLFADNFKNLNFADIYNIAHTTSINLVDNEVMPAVIEQIVELEYDSDASTTVRRGNYVMIPYEETLLQTQVLASETQNLNPFNVFVKEGVLELNPPIDTWKVNKTVNEEVDKGVVTGSVADYPVREIVTEETALTYIRHRKVFFRATGLKPDHRYFLFFGSVDISAYARDEAEDKILPSFFGPYAEKYTGDTYKDYTTHPETSSELYTDAQGVLVGSFFIPRNDEIEFQSGIKNVLLVDVTTTDLSAATSYASTTYEAQGTLITETVTTYKYEFKTSSGSYVSTYNDNDDKGYYVFDTKDPNAKIAGRTTYRSTQTIYNKSKTFETYSQAKAAQKAYYGGEASAAGPSANEK